MADGSDGVLDPDVLDRAVLRRVFDETGGDEEFLADLVSAYLEDGARLLEDVRSAWAGDERERLQRSAHTLKSSSASLGVRVVASLSAGIEAAAKQGERPPADDIDALADAWSQASSALGQFDLASLGEAGP